MESAAELLASGGGDGLRWLERLERVGPPAFRVTLPDVDALAPVLLDLAVPHEEIDALVRLRPSRQTSPALWWILERCVHRLVRAMGEVGGDGAEAGPALPAHLGPIHRCFYVYVFAATLPYLRAYHRARGIPAAVSRQTLTDLGRHMAVHRWRSGETGLGRSWLPLHLRGLLFQLGRLQFERQRAAAGLAEHCAAAGVACVPGDPILAVHVPEFSGPLSPAACQRSLVWARRFFARHFPDEPVRVATCSSWLLDEQLAEYLPADSNIVRFQRRFQPLRRWDDDQAVQTFVFGRQYPDPAQIPRRTTLQRAIADHLRAGRHWRGVVGWLAL